MFPTERSNLKIELHHERTIKSLQELLIDKINPKLALLTPKMPRMTKNMISKKCQSRSYVTWNNTNFPVLKGFIACMIHFEAAQTGWGL